MSRRLTVKEQAFIAAYLGEARGNGTEAVVLAGFNVNRKSAGVYATRLLAKSSIRQAIDTALAKVESAAIATIEELDAVTTAIVRGEGLVSADNRLRGIDILNKVKGRYVTRLADADGKPLSFTVVTGVPDPS